MKSRCSPAALARRNLNPTNEFRGESALLADHPTMEELAPEHWLDVLTKKTQALAVLQDGCSSRRQAPDRVCPVLQRRFPRPIKSNGDGLKVRPFALFAMGVNQPPGQDGGLDIAATYDSTDPLRRK